MSEDRAPGFATLAVHAGAKPDPTTGARATPIYQTTSYVFNDVDHAASLFGLQAFGNIYTRIMSPTSAVLEERIAALEGGTAGLAVASGHAAQVIILHALMTPGDELIAARQLYGGSINQFNHSFKSFGWNVKWADIDDISSFEKAVTPKTKAIFIESIANPGGVVTDIEAVAAVAKRAGVPLVVDNTLATPYLCRPIEFGADIVVHSLTKFIGGHGNSIGGVVVDGGNFDWEAHAERERLAHHGRGRVVHDQRHAELAADGRDLRDREDLQLRVGQRLGVPAAGAGIGGADEGLRVLGVHEADLDAELLQRIGEEVPGAAIEVRRGDDVVARLAEVHHGEGRRRLARSEREGGDAAFQRRDALLQHVHGRVHDAGVDVAHLLQREEARGMAGVVELEGGRLVDRDRDRAGGGIGAPAGMKRDRFRVGVGHLVSPSVAQSSHRARGEGKGEPCFPPRGARMAGTSPAQAPRAASPSNSAARSENSRAKAAVSRERAERISGRTSARLALSALEA